MTNNVEVIAPNAAVVANIKAGKGLDTLVKSALGLYDKSNRMLHLTASGVIYHALYHGNTTPMNALYNSVEKHRVNDATAFWSYISAMCAMKDDEGKPTNLFVFSKEQGFRLNKKFGENIRKSTLSFEDLMASKPFYTADVAPPAKKEIGLIELLDMLKKAVNKTEKKGDELAIDIPANVIQAGKELIRQIDHIHVAGIVTPVAGPVAEAA